MVRSSLAEFQIAWIGLGILENETLTGLGERAHLADRKTNLETHVADVAGLLEMEDLEQVVLAGHSYAGMVIAGVADRITIHVGDALEFLSEQKEPYDIIFNDVDKEDYPRVLRMAAPKLRSGGLFVTDNVLWSGRVAEKNPAEASTKAILAFNQALYATPELFSTILPIRDGVAVAVKR